jgi:glycosyltransferase involved in cell wall biosynthesis
MPDSRLPPQRAGPRVLVTVASYSPGFRGGGPARSVASIVQTADPELQISILTRDRDIGGRRPYEGLSGRCVTAGNSRVCYLNPRSPRQLTRFIREARRTRIDVLYLNSLWEPTFSIAALAAAWTRVLPAASVLLAPRGELAPGAMQLKSLKKRLAMRLLRTLISRLDVTWHASTQVERDEIQAWFPTARVLVNINPTSLPERAIEPVASERATLSAVFLSRISPKKNLSAVLEALAGVPSPVELDIYGPREDPAYWRRCMKLAEACPPNIVVRYRGEAAPEQVRKIFARYDCFLFPTRGENFGHALAESLSAACPIVCPDTTPWTTVLASGGGVVVDRSVEALRQAIEEFAAASPAQRHARRVAAAKAYEAWRDEQPSCNVLDEFLAARGRAVG